MRQFDYIVVGAGSAGCVLANRLSADPGQQVLLLEAGPRDQHWAIPIPAGVAQAIMTPTINWGFFSAPQPALGGRKLVLPRGKVLGGSSSINGMVYFRGHPADFDDWSSWGCKGWSYAEVLPYFIRSEDNADFGGSPYHGVGGPMRVSSPRRPNRLVSSFVEATRALDLPQCEDFNAADPTGFGERQSTIRDGRRESMASAFLREAEQRPNLTVVTLAVIDRVVFEGNRAIGVEAIVNGERVAFGCRKEVVVSAGAYGSPTILLRSGIGPGAQLAQHGIPVVSELAGVGQGLQDHPSAAVQMKTSDTTSYGVSLRSMPRNLLNLCEYVLFRKGPVAGNVFEATGFIKSRPELDRPDLQLVFMPAHRNAKPYPVPFGHGYGVLSIAVRPKSRGSVTLASRDPAAAPIIDLNFFGESEDVECVRAGLKLARRILAQPAFQRYRAREILPGPVAATDAALDEYARKTAVTVHHPGCSARMGVDQAAVVDEELRVRGVTGLRVADASVFPSVIAGNTNAAVVMIAEKASDMILGRTPPQPIDPRPA